MNKITRIINKESESIDKYFKEIKNINLLTGNEEIELAKKINKHNDVKLINKLIISNLRFVITVAKEFQNQGLPIEDLISEGNIGLIMAANKFDHTKGFKFISYAVWWIRHSILKSLSEDSRTIRLPNNQIKNINNIKKILNKLEHLHERTPSNYEISDLLNINIKKVNEGLSLSGKCISIDEPLYNNDFTSYSLSDIIENKESLIPDYNMTNEPLPSQIEKSLNALNEREKQIIMQFFGLNNFNKMTLESIGRNFGITKERTRQIKERAIRKIRSKLPTHTS